MSDTRVGLRSHPLDRALALGLSALVGLGLWALLRRGLFEGQAQSHDAPLYVRSLWGIAHGDYNNSLIDYPSLAIHSQFALLVLAPFARIWHPADVLISTQALAFAATLFVWLGAVLRAGRAANSSSAPWLAAWACVLFTYGMPLLANPFVFDVRPEMLGVFFASAGLLRSAERQRFDLPALSLLILSAATREEFALIAACALMLSPVARTDLRARAIIAGLLVLYVGCNNYFWPRSESQAAHLTSDAPWRDLVGSKLQLLAAFVGAGGGLVVFGYRWLGSALPGLGVLALSTWMASDQISFHYGMFVAPALLSASYAGYAALLERPRVPRVWLGAHVAITVACAAWLSALPGGARFARQHFDLQGPLLSAATWRAHTAWLADVHRLLQFVPQDQSLLVQYMLATAYAARPTIRVFEVENKNAWQPDAVLLPQKLWATRGRELRARGYQLAGLSGSSYALLSRHARPALASILPAEGCESVSVRWPDVGIELCNAFLEADGYATVLVGRSLGTTPHGLQLELSAGTETLTLAPLDGLIALDDLPSGRVAWSKTARALPTSKVTFALRLPNGQVVPLFVQGQQKERVTLTLLPPR